MFLITSYANAEVGPLSQHLEWYESLEKSSLSGNAHERITRLEAQIEEAKSIADFERESTLRKELGMLLLLRIPDYGRAIDQFILALQLEEKHDLGEDQIITYIAMGRVFEMVGDYHKSSELLERALHLSESYREAAVLIYLANKLGKLNAAKGHLDAALENYEIVLIHNDSVASPRAKAEALFNKAHVHTLKQQYDRALALHKQALAIWRRLGSTDREAQSLNDIGELYRLMKEDEKALKNFVAALSIRTRLDDLTGLAQSYNNAGVLYFNKRNYERATANLVLGLEAAQSAQAAEQIARAHEFLSHCYKAVGDSEKSLNHLLAYTQLIEFMRNEKAETELLEAENRYVLDKKELEIRHLELEQRRREEKIKTQQQLQNFLFTIIGFGVIIVCLIFFLYLTKRRATIALQAAHARVASQNVQLQNLNATKDKFFSIISHDLKGPLNSFISFSRMLIDHTDSLTRDEIQMLAREINNNLKNLLTLLENLLEWSRSQTGNIEFKPENFDLRELLLQNRDLLNAQASNKGITILCDEGDPGFTNAHKHSVNTVIRNLVSNAIKFTPQGGTITLALRREGNEFVVSIADTGVGMSPETLKKLFRLDTKYTTHGTANEKGTGLGLILCKDFIEKNGGTIGVESHEGKGTVFFFRLPAVDSVSTKSTESVLTGVPVSQP